MAVLDGVHLLGSLLDQGGAPAWGAVTAAALARTEVARAVALSAARGTEWFELPETLFRAVAPTEHPAGVLALHALPAQAAEPSWTDFTLLLEGIQDPGNLGTLLRSAQGAGLAQVALSSDCAEPWSPKVLRAAMGAHFGLRLVEDCDLPAFAKRHGGVLAAAADASTTAWRSDLAGAGGLAIGNEGSGLSRSLRAACAADVAIPLAPGCESLNAAVAGAVLLFERARQRGG
jgi:TrmH family RNA methyltransferase